MLQLSYDTTGNSVEAGIDEAGRGCLSGRVYAAAVILPPEFPDDTYMQIKDSKKLSRKKRAELRQYIEKHAIAYSVAYAEPSEIDEINILQATLRTMHRAVDGLRTTPDTLLVDGTQFEFYMTDEGDVIPHHLIQKGDNKFFSIAAASILAKEYHDEYVKHLCAENPELKKYGWEQNMCYGTKQHRDAIVEHGLTIYHRKTFGICKHFC